MGRQARPPLSAWSSGATVTGVAEVLRESEQHYRDSLAGEVLPRTVPSGPVVGAPGGRINIEPIILRKKIEERRILGAFCVVWRS